MFFSELITIFLTYFSVTMFSWCIISFKIHLMISKHNEYYLNIYKLQFTLKFDLILIFNLIFDFYHL